MNERVCKTCLSFMYLHELPGWLKCPSCGFMFKGANSMISMTEVLQGRAKFEDLPDELQKNGNDLLIKLNKFREIYGIPMVVVSGYRTPEINAAANGAKGSAHMSLQACDFKDEDGKLKAYIAANPNILEKCDLYQEDPKWTPTWVHLQNRKTSSGNRIFIP